MLGVVINETEIINDALEGKFDEDNVIVVLNLLLKHYYLNGMQDKLQLREQLLNFLKNYYKGYKRAKWEETTSKIVDRNLKLIKKNKIEVRMINIKEIPITEIELSIIKNLNNISLEKLAFVMLVYAKISNIIMNSGEGWIKQSCSTICKEAKVNLKGREKEEIFNDLYSMGYIEQRKNNAKTNLKICYIDHSEEPSIGMTIGNFDGVVYQYLIAKGEKWKQCECCGKWVKLKTANSKQKYCKTCAKIENIKRTQENRKKFEM
jgi:hypothetical protein